MTDQLTAADVLRDFQVEDQESIDMMNRWLARGDGVAVYENKDLGHPELGHRQYLSFGSPDAQLEVEEPPKRMPDFPTRINWRYYLVGTYRGEPLSI